MLNGMNFPQNKGTSEVSASDINKIYFYHTVFCKIIISLSKLRVIFIPKTDIGMHPIP